MRLRRSALTVATIAALSFTAVAPAQAQEAGQPQSSQSENVLSSEGDSQAALAGDSGSSESSSSSSSQKEKEEGTEEGQDAKTWWNNLHPILKFMVGTAAATGIFVVFGMLRTLFYNIAGV